MNSNKTGKSAKKRATLVSLTLSKKERKLEKLNHLLELVETGISVTTKERKKAMKHKANINPEWVYEQELAIWNQKNKDRHAKLQYTKFISFGNTLTYDRVKRQQEVAKKNEQHKKILLKKELNLVSTNFKEQRILDIVKASEFTSGWDILKNLSYINKKDGLMKGKTFKFITKLSYDALLEYDNSIVYVVKTEIYYEECKVEGFGFRYLRAQKGHRIFTPSTKRELVKVLEQVVNDRENSNTIFLSAKFDLQPIDSFKGSVESGMFIRRNTKNFTKIPTHTFVTQGSAAFKAIDIANIIENESNADIQLVKIVNRQVVNEIFKGRNLYPKNAFTVKFIYSKDINFYKIEYNKKEAIVRLNVGINDESLHLIAQDLMERTQRRK